FPWPLWRVRRCPAHQKIAEDGLERQGFRQTFALEPRLVRMRGVTNRMSLGLDPIVSSLFYSLSLVPHLKRPARGAPSGNRELTVLPYVSVLVTFCQETRADIEMTVSSLLAQTYPPDS